MTFVNVVEGVNEILPPENGVYEGVNGLSKCSFCRRRIPKRVFRHTKKGGYYRATHNICASCFVKMAKIITKKKGQKKLKTSRRQ